MTEEDENEVISLLNRSKNLYLRHISEPRDNSLRLVAEEAVVASQSEIAQTKMGPFSEILRGARPIQSIGNCKTFELQWSQYVAYIVTEEVVGSAGNHEGEIYTGKLFRVYTKSHFLDYLSRDTGGHTEPILHYKLICLNHLIDVASYDPPEIQLLGTGSEDRSETPSRAN